MATRITNKKLSKSSRAWMKEHIDDHYVKLAQRDAVGVHQAVSDPAAADAILFVELRIPLYEGGVLRAQKRKALTQLRETEQRLQAAERGALHHVGGPHMLGEESDVRGLSLDEDHPPRFASTP